MSKPLVVLDTNAVFDDPYFRGSQVGRLLSLARRGYLEVAVPEIVLQELQRQQRKTVSGKLDYLLRAESRVLEAMRALGIEEAKHEIVLPDVRGLRPDTLLDSIYRDVRARLESNSVEVLPLPTVEHQTLLNLDLAGRPPFAANGKGYRDALIWYSIVERWSSTPLFVDAFIVTNDDDFGAEGIASSLSEMLPAGSQPVRLRTLEDLFSHPAVEGLDNRLQAEIEDSALHDELEGRSDVQIETHRALNAAAESAVRGVIDSIDGYGVSLSDRSRLDIPREFQELEMVSAMARGDFEWSLYDQLDGETLLGEGSMWAEAEFSAEVHKDDAAVLANPQVDVESWEFDTARIAFWRDVQLHFSLRLGVGGNVEEVSLASVSAAG